MKVFCSVCGGVSGHESWCTVGTFVLCNDPDLCGCGGSDGNHLWWCQVA